MSNFWSVYSQSPEAAIAGTFDKDGKIKPPEKGQVQDIGKKLVIGQVPAMLAGSTADIIDLAKVLNDLNAKYGGNTQLLSHLAKPLIDKVQSTIGREAFTKGFNQYAKQYNLPFRDDPDNPANTLGGLISIGGAYKLGVKFGKEVIPETVKSTVEAVKEVKNIFKGKGPPMGPQPELAGVGSVESVDDINKQTNKLLDKTPPASQAKAQISPTLIGINTDIGKKQAKIFEELEAQNKFTPEELFEQTGVYRSKRDGKLRYDLDDSNASLKLDIGDRANLIASGESIRLEELFNFPELYKEYPKANILKKMQNKLTGQKTFVPLKDITVKFVRKPELKFNAAYDTDTDSIMINMANMINDKDLIESKIIHEIQHAVQHREGFLSGGSSLDIIENLPRSDEYLQLVKKYGEDTDPLFGSIENFDIKKQQFFEDQLIDIAQSDPAYYKALVDDIDNMTFLGTRNDNTRFLEYLGELENKLLKETNLSENAITRIKGNLSKLVSDHRQEKIFIENMQATAMQQYKDLYGEREAKLVEQIYNRRKANQPSQKNLLVEEFGGGQKNQKFDVQKEGKGISYDLDKPRLDIDYDYIEPSREFYDQLSVEDMSKLSDTNLENLISIDTSADFNLFETNPKAYKAAEIKQKALFDELKARRKKYADRFEKIQSLLDENPSLKNDFDMIYSDAHTNAIETLYQNPNQYGEIGKNPTKSLAYEGAFLNSFDTIFNDSGLAEKGYKYNKGGVAKQMSNLRVGKE